MNYYFIIIINKEISKDYFHELSIQRVQNIQRINSSVIHIFTF